MLSLSGLKTLQMARWMHSDFSQIKVLYNICVSESMKCFERDDPWEGCTIILMSSDCLVNQ